MPWLKDSTKTAKVISRLDKWLLYMKNNAVMVGHHVFIGCFGFLVITVSWVFFRYKNELYIFFSSGSEVDWEIVSLDLCT